MYSIHSYTCWCLIDWKTVYLISSYVFVIIMKIIIYYESNQIFQNYLRHLPKYKCLLFGRYCPIHVKFISKSNGYVCQTSQIWWIWKRDWQLSSYDMVFTKQWNLINIWQVIFLEIIIKHKAIWPIRDSTCIDTDAIK